VLTYDETKGASFSTYLYRKVRWAIFDAHRSSKALKNSQICFSDFFEDRSDE